MSVKSIVIKAVVAALVVAILTALIVFVSKPQTDETKKPISVYSYDADKIEKIEIISENPFTLVKDESGWTMPQMQGIKVNGAYADALAKSVTDISSPMLVKKNIERLGEYGMDKPLCKICLTYTDGTEALYIGNKSGEYYYLATESQKDVYIVAKNNLSMAFMDKVRYLDNTAFEIDIARVNKISYSDVLISRNGDEWMVEEPYQRGADTNVVETKILEKLQKITAVDIVKADEAVLDEFVEVAAFAGDDEKISFRVYSIDDTYSYVQCDGSRYAYKVLNEDVDFVKMGSFDVVIKYVAPIAITEVSKIELTSPSGRTVLSIDAPDSEAPVFYKNGKEVSEESFRSFYQAMMALTVTDAGAAQGAAEYAIVFTKADGEKYDVRFISAGDSHLAVSIDGKTLFIIPRKSVTDVFDKLESLDTI